MKLFITLSWVFNEFLCVLVDFVSYKSILTFDILLFKSNDSFGVFVFDFLLSFCPVEQLLVFEEEVVLIIRKEMKIMINHSF